MQKWPHYSENEISAVSAVLRSGHVNYWTGGECRKFETEFASLCQTKYAVAVANGTLALELALRALDIGPGDEVIVPSRTFIATASSVVSCGARPVFADIDRHTQNITAESIQNVLSLDTKAIIAVHLAGWPCDMDPILKLAGKHKLKVIEDCSQAHGALYKERPVGSLGDVAAFSFCQDKIISTGGEGGMLVTNNEDIWKKSWAYKDHGKSYDAVYHTKHQPGFRWLHHSFGSNWRMTEMQAAIGRIQITQLPEWHQQRIRAANVLTSNFKDILAIRICRPPDNVEHAYYKYDVFIRPEWLEHGWNRDRIMLAINDKGVPCFSGSCSEVYLEKAFNESGLKPANRLPVARELGRTGLSFMIHPGLTDEDLKKMCMAVKSVMQKATSVDVISDFDQDIFTGVDQGLLLDIPDIVVRH